METDNVDKLVIVATHGCEDPERASLPFVMGNAALAMDTQAVVVLQGTAVLLATKGCYERVFAAGMPSLKELVDSFLEFGGLLLVCTPCIQERRITPDMLLESAKPIKAARVIMELSEASATLCF